MSSFFIHLQQVLRVNKYRPPVVSINLEIQSIKGFDFPEPDKPITTSISTFVNFQKRLLTHDTASSSKDRHLIFRLTFSKLFPAFSPKIL